MKQWKLFCLIGVTLIMSACGGGNGGRVDSPNPSSSSASSSSAPGEPYANCSEAEGGVFINTVCSPWRDVSAYEQRPNPFNWEEVTDGQGNAITYAIIDTDDPAHNQVLDIQYATESDYTGNVRMLSPETSGYDMSEFANGKIVFDLKVIQPGVENPDVEFNLDCVYPCASTPILIKNYVLNQWQTVEVPVQDLVERGLDLEKITTGFMIAPTWGKSAGAHYQVDNIRWEKGSQTPTEFICFANHFDVQWVQGVQGPGVQMQGIDFYIPESQHIGGTIGVHPVELKPDWSLMQGVWAYSMSEAISYQTGELLEPSTLSACSASGTLSMLIYVPKSYVDDGYLTFTIHALDEYDQRFELSDTVFSMADMTPDEWNKVSIPLSASTYYENLKYVGLTFDSLSIDTSIDDALKIDSIIIKQPFTSASSVSSSVNNSSFSSSSLAGNVSSSFNNSSLNSSSAGNSSSSASEITAEPYANCAAAEGGVFINNVCSPWRDLSAYEMNISNFGGEEVVDGQGNAVTFSIIDTSDPAHNQVVDMQFANQFDYTAVVRMLVPDEMLSGRDMSEYANGTFIFDLKVINAGTEGADVEFNLDCVYPCASTHIPIKEYELNQWQTIEVPVQQLVERGLDLTKVTTGFMISPTWKKQAGAHYQVDNVRWEKGDMEVTESICFANHFDLQWISGVQGPGITIQDVNFSVPDSQRYGATIGVHPVELKPDWSLMQGVWAFSMSEGMDYTTGDLIEPSTLSECSSAGTLSLNIFVPKSYVDDGSLSFTFHVLDENLQRYELSDTVFSMADMTPDDWNKVSIPLSAETQHDNLKYVGLTFDSTLIDWSIEDALKIDNIIIKQPLPQ